MKVYGAMYNDCIYESAEYAISLHRSIKGAYNAMRDHLLKEYSEWEQGRLLIGKDKGEKFGWAASWRVKPLDLQD